jgi:DDE domain
MAELKASGALPISVELRQIKYLNNLVEQDHRFIKRLVKPGMGFFSFETAWRTLQGYEVMHMLRKGQVHGVEKGDIKDQVIFIACLPVWNGGLSSARKGSALAHRSPLRVFATQPLKVGFDIGAGLTACYRAFA